MVNDRPPFYGATVKDITQRVEMESALRNSEVQYRKLFDSAGDAIVIMNDEKIVDVNKKTQDLLGYSRDNILSTPPPDFFALTQPNGQDSRELFAEMVEASRSGNPQCFEWTGQNIDSTPIHTEVTLTTFTLDEKKFTQLIIRDFSERKKIEGALVELNKTLEERVEQRTQELENAYAQLLQKNVHYRELAKRLTQAEEQERKRISLLLHDNHQQLIVAARLRVEMLQSGSQDPGVKNAAQHVLDILGQAAEITRSLTLELSPPILFGSGLVVAIESLARRMEKEHQLKVIVLDSLPSTSISTDVSDALFRAVREFLFNVVKHAGAREAQVNIALFDQHLVLTVEDKGVGFDASGTLDSVGGYGLFSIQEQLSFLDGRLHISSAPNRGTICTVSIPMVTEDSTNLEISPAMGSITMENTEMLRVTQDPIRILVVDDHEVARKVLVQILTLAEDFDVVGEASDDLDAIEKTRTLKPDLILMDVTVPQLNGVEATRSIMTKFSGVKVIGLSMHSSEEMASSMLRVGATSCLQKFTPDEKLFDTIRRSLSGSEDKCV